MDPFLNFLKFSPSYPSPSLCIVLLFCNILRAKDNFPLPPTGEHEELEGN